MLCFSYFFLIKSGALQQTIECNKNFWADWLPIIEARQRIRLINRSLLTDAFPTRGRSKHNKGWTSRNNCDLWIDEFNSQEHAYQGLEWINEKPKISLLLKICGDPFNVPKVTCTRTHPATHTHTHTCTHIILTPSTHFTIIGKKKWSIFHFANKIPDVFYHIILHHIFLWMW